MLDKYQEGDSFEDSAQQVQALAANNHAKQRSMGGTTVISKDNITFNTGTNKGTPAPNSPQGNNFMGTAF